MESGAPAPKKYIRTLAGDMEILKKGGTPDLSLLTEPLAPPKMVVPTAAPPTPIEIPIPLPPTEEPTPSVNLGPIPEFQVNKPAIQPVTPFSIPEIETPLVPPLPLPQPPIPQIPVPAPVPEPTPSQLWQEAMPLETYASDFSDRIKNMNASTSTVLAAEQDAAPHVPQPTIQKSSHSTLYSIAGVLLLIAGIGGVYVAYTRNLEVTPPAISTPVASAPIFVDEQEQVAGTGIALLQAIEQSMDKQLASGSIRFLYLADATTTGSSIFSALQLPAPNVLLRNVSSVDGMAGIINVAGKQNPFFILSVASYSDTFSGMLSWESVMPRDLAQLFRPYPAPTPITMATSTATVASTTAQKIATTTTSAPVFKSGFRDEVVNNHDTRVYRDTSGRSVLLYGYWNQKTLVIARDPAAFIEILDRLASARAQ
ncbi:MAG: hypothetical protein WCS97_02370 [Candidatus Paceibacterota bacterium]|jgi:hypothetical protein